MLPGPSKSIPNEQSFPSPALIAAVFVLSLVALELKTSWLQSHLFSAVARRLTYTVQPGPGPHVPYPPQGPYDLRVGYARLPAILDRLNGAGYTVVAQARQDTSFGRLASRFLFPAYREKTQAGLDLLDRTGQPLFAVRTPQRTYPDFASIPPAVVHALLFIENREMLDEGQPFRNPAVEWDRFGKAVLDFGYRKFDPSHSLSGGSTLATQLEKTRHSPGGRTDGAAEKLRQMASASLRAYLDGEQTLEARKRIIRDYINSMPLAALPGYGEVTGLGDGLFAWFGADLEHVSRLLREKELPRDPALVSERARAFRQVLSLLLALKKPSAYLTRERPELDARVDAYLHLLAGEGVVDPALCDAALQIPAGYRDVLPRTEPVSFVERKATDAIRTELRSLLGTGTAYDLDRLDLTVLTTIDRNAQQGVTDVLRRLGDPDYARKAGLRGHWLLGHGDPAAVVYGFTLFERGEGGDLLRVQADNYERPMNVSEGAKLELGSTAKLRTLVHYLEIVADLHARHLRLSPDELRAVTSPRQDRLTRWAVEYLSTAGDESLEAMFEAALSRRYSASPDEFFFTGGGVHRFANFDRKDNVRTMSVREAFRKSVNLVFIRLMRDIVNYHVARLPGVTPDLLEDPRNPARRIFLSRFADMEGRLFLARFHEKYRGGTPERMLRTLVDGLRTRSPHRLAVIYRTVRPGDGPDRFAAFLRAHPAGTALTDKAVAELYERYGPDTFTLADRGYLAGVHPLELWLLEYRYRNPEATRNEILSAGAAVRQDVYGWLFTSRFRSAQNSRIRTALEAEAFGEIHRAWKRLGFPFRSLVPSYATAIGSSGDSPAALAELMGILVHDGVRYPARRLLRLRFGEGTPVDTVVDPRPADGARILPPELARAVKRELLGVVKAGTARRIAGAIVLPDGAALEVGGKTGTGDNRYELFTRQGRPIGSRVVSRTATFVFLIGDRFYGTVTAFVPGPQAAGYDFTSALPVQVLKHLVPTLMPLLSDPSAAAS